MSGGIIGGIAAGISSLLIVSLVWLVFWYRRRHRKPAVLPQDVLGAEFAADESDNGEATDSSTHLGPFVHSTITRYPVPPPIPPTPSSASHDSPKRPGSSSSHATHKSESGRSRLVVHNADGPSFEAVSEKRRVEMRERGRVQDPGPVTYASGSNEGAPPPEYRQGSEPFRIIEKR